MPDPIWDKMFALGKVMHWAGKYEESFVCIELAKFLKERGVEDVKAFEDLLSRNLEG